MMRGKNTAIILLFYWSIEGLFILRLTDLGITVFCYARIMNSIHTH